MAQVVTQVFPDLAGKAFRVGNDIIQAAVFRQPLDRGFWPHLGNPRHVVRCVADQGKVIDNTLRRHSIFFYHAGAIKPGIVHGIDQVNVIINNLRQVLVAGGYQGIHPGACSPGRQGCNHVIRLDTVFTQQAYAKRFDDFVQRFDLGHQVKRGRGTIGFILRIQVITETFSLGIENDCEIIRPFIPDQLAQHVDYAVDGPGWLIFRVREARHGMIGPEQVIGPVHQRQ